jgi:hypothetical protein
MFKLPSPWHEWIMAVPLWIPLLMAMVGMTILLTFVFGAAINELTRDK